jgi:hypothetical protein
MKTIMKKKKWLLLVPVLFILLLAWKLFRGSQSSEDSHHPILTIFNQSNTFTIYSTSTNHSTSTPPSTNSTIIHLKTIKEKEKKKKKRTLKLKTVHGAILILGQSNAESQNLGPIDPVRDSSHERVFTVYPPFWNGSANKLVERRIAKQPLPFAGPWTAISDNSVVFSLNFAKLLLSSMNETMGYSKHCTLTILNAAYAGSSLQVSGLGSWQPNIEFHTDSPQINHYNSAISFWKEAIHTFHLQPLVYIMIQGESDIGIASDTYTFHENQNYKQQWLTLFSTLRLTYDLPILVGSLLDNLYHLPNHGSIVEDTHKNISHYMSRSWFVPFTNSDFYTYCSSHLNTSNIETLYESNMYYQWKKPDGQLQPLHYSAEGQRFMAIQLWETFDKNQP